jgi:subtilisin family serine protease
MNIMSFRTTWLSGTLMIATLFTFTQCEGPVSVNPNNNLERVNGALNGANPNQTMGQEIPGQLIVIFKEGTGNPGTLARQLAQASQGDVLFTYESVLQGFALKVPPQAQQTVLMNLSRNPNVFSVEVDQVVTLEASQTSATWGLDRVDQRLLPLNSTYNYDGSGAGVNAYILDTGINYSHVDFGGRAVFGYSAFGDNGVDGNGHGTHVAGTVGGATWGVAKNVTLVSVKVLDASGSGSWSGVIAGIDWVAKNKGSQPAVINMSLGGGAYTTLDNAIQNAISAGVTVVVAAGNSNADACNYSPARAKDAITVGSTSSNDARSSFSNFGTCLDVFAPGSSITSAWYTSTSATATISGTSMASPHVAGVAALYLGANPSMNPAQVDYAIKLDATSNVVGSAGTGSPNLLLYSMNSNNGGMEPPPTTPSLGVNPSSLTFGSVTTSSNVVQSYTITGSNLTANVSVTAPSGFQVSTSSSSGFANSLTLTPSSGSVNRLIYVRFTPTAAQNYSGNVNNSSTGANSVLVGVSGTGVTPELTITLMGLAKRDNKNRWVADLNWNGITTTRVDLYMSTSSTSLGTRFARLNTSGSGSFSYTINNTGSGTRYFRACNNASTTQCSPVVTLTW